MFQNIYWWSWRSQYEEASTVTAELHLIMTVQSNSSSASVTLFQHLMRCTEDKKVAAELKQADVGVGGGVGAMEWRYFGSPWSRGGRDTDVREQKFPRERRRVKSARFSALHCGAQFVRAWASNWLCILTSLHTFLPCIPGHLLWELWPWVYRWDEAERLSRFIFRVFFPFELCCYYLE